MLLPFSSFYEDFSCTNSQPAGRVPSSEEMQMYVIRWTEQQSFVSARNTSGDSEESTLTCPYRCTSVYVCTEKVSQGNIDMLYSEHMEQRWRRGPGCCVSSSVLHSDDLFQHTVTLSPPLSICWNNSFYRAAANLKRQTPLSLQSKLEMRAQAKRCRFLS